MRNFADSETFITTIYHSIFVFSVDFLNILSPLNLSKRIQNTSTISFFTNIEISKCETGSSTVTNEDYNLIPLLLIVNCDISRQKLWFWVLIGFLNIKKTV